MPRTRFRAGRESFESLEASRTLLKNPRGGVGYPRASGEFQAWFRTDDDCRDYIEWLRWPDGWRCSDCAGTAEWHVGDGRIMCAGCGSRTSVTAGTIFDKTRTPLTVWFLRGVAVCHG